MFLYLEGRIGRSVSERDPGTLITTQSTRTHAGCRRRGLLAWGPDVPRRTAWEGQASSVRTDGAAVSFQGLQTLCPGITILLLCGNAPFPLLFVGTSTNIPNLYPLRQ